MNQQQAKEILLLYRPGSRDAQDPEIAEALALAERDPDLGQWFAEQQAFHNAVRAKLRQLPAPERLKQAIVAQQKVIHPPQALWRQPAWIAAAAAFVALLGLSALLLRPSVPDRFAHYRESMVEAAVRMYGMDLVTEDSGQLRQFISAKGAPADYSLTRGLARLQLKGGGLLRWRGNPVSMVCFDRGSGDTLFLFVVKRAAVKDSPSTTAERADLVRVDGLMTASWTNGADTYVLAGPNEPGFAEKYLASR